MANNEQPTGLIRLVMFGGIVADLRPTCAGVYIEMKEYPAVHWMHEDEYIYVAWKIVYWARLMPYNISYHPTCVKFSPRGALNDPIGWNNYIIIYIQIYLWTALFISVSPAAIGIGHYGLMSMRWPCPVCPVWPWMVPRRTCPCSGSETHWRRWADSPGCVRSSSPWALSILKNTIARVNIILTQDCRSVFKTQTCELTAQELHAQCAVLPADLWVNADVLRFDWRTEGVGRGGIIISISSEYLQ